MPGDGEKACFMSSRIAAGIPASQQNPDASVYGESPFGPLSVTSSALTGGRTLISCWNGWKGCPDLSALQLYALSGTLLVSAAEIQVPTTKR